MPRINFTFKITLFFIAPFFLQWTLAAGQGYQIQSTYSDASSSITSIAKNSVRNLLVSGDQKGNIYFRSLEDATLIKTLEAHGNAVNTINFNSTGQLMISSTIDGEIKIYDFDKEKIIQGIYSPDYNGMRFVLFSIADGFIYFNSKNKLYKTRSDLSQNVNLISEYQDSLYSAVITTDRNSLILATGNKLIVMNTRTDQLRQEISTGASPNNFRYSIGEAPVEISCLN